MTADGRPVHIRYRWGELSVRVGPAGGSVADAIGSEPLLYTELGETLGSCADRDEGAAFTGIALVPASADRPSSHSRRRITSRRTGW